MSIEGVADALLGITAALEKLQTQVARLEKRVDDLTNVVDATSTALAAQIRNALEPLGGEDDPVVAAAVRAARRAARRHTGA